MREDAQSESVAVVERGFVRPPQTDVLAEKGFLFPVRALSKVFRGKFVAALEDLHTSPRLAAAFDTEHAWRQLKRELYAHDWVVYAKQPLAGAPAVLDYLGRYTHRVALRNERILGIEADQVPLRLRSDATSGKRHTLRIAGTEFIRRFLLHVLPPVFKRIRHYGLLAPARKKAASGAARTALALPTPQPALIESVAAFLTRIGRIEQLRCPHSGAALRVIGTIAPRLIMPRARRLCLRAQPPAGPRKPRSAPHRRRHAARFSCHWIDFARRRLTIPIATAFPAVQSNKVYPPP